jgi:AAA family ATP:ADP antiporter
VSLVVTNVIERRERAPYAATGPARPRDEAPIATGGPLRAFQLVLGHRYLLLIALLTMLLNWVNTSGEYILGRTVAQAAKEAVSAGTATGLTEKEFVGKFYSDFQFWVNVIAVGAQLFLVSRILKYIGVRAALLILPIIAFGGYLIIAFVPILSIVRWAKTAENATDYSLQSTLRGVLFLPTTREEKYIAKQATDTFFWRAGDALQALVVWLGTAFLGFKTREFAVFNLVLVGAWITIAALLGRENAKLVRASEPGPASR